MRLCTWNVRGLNYPIKRRGVKRYVTTQHIVVVGLLETRIKERNKSRILQTELIII